METSQWRDVLTLLTVAVVVDQRVYKEEVDAFRAQAMGLREALSPDMLFTDKMALDWFVVHRQQVMDWLREPDSHTQILRHILKLRNVEGRQKILNAMYAISVSDTEYHPSEVDVIGLAVKHWGVELPENLDPSANCA